MEEPRDDYGPIYNTRGDNRESRSNALTPQKPDPLLRVIGKIALSIAVISVIGVGTLFIVVMVSLGCGFSPEDPCGSGIAVVVIRALVVGVVGVFFAVRDIWRKRPLKRNA